MKLKKYLKSGQSLIEYILLVAISIIGLLTSNIIGRARAQDDTNFFKVSFQAAEVYLNPNSSTTGW